MQAIKDFFDTSAGAACIGGGATTLALIGAAMALWPEVCAVIVFG